MVQEVVSWGIKEFEAVGPYGVESCKIVLILMGADMGHFLITCSDTASQTYNSLVYCQLSYATYRPL